MGNQSPFSFHEGEALLRLAGTYGTLQETILEAIQNALDSNASWIGVNVNEKSRTITVRDNGWGVSREKFETALTSVCRSIKQEDKLGRFGLGLISPLGKCKRFTFTSTPREDAHQFLQWTFVTDDLRKQEEIGGIPCASRSDLWYGREGGSGHGVNRVSWRTEVNIQEYTGDRFISRMTLESLRDGILEKYSPIMRRRSVLVTITIVDEAGERVSLEVRAPDFEGVKLPEKTFMGVEKAAPVLFRLYLTRKNKKGERVGKVQLGEFGNEFRISLRSFIQSLRGESLSDDAQRALLSGLFEGEILTKGAKIAPDRRSFTADDNLTSLILAIEEWYEKVGAECYQAARETRQEERHQDLGIRSLRVIEEMLRQPECAEFMRVVKEFRKGNIGTGHFDLPGVPSPEVAINVDGHPTKDGNGTHERGEPKGERKGHHPFTVTGPKGERRKIVRSSSLGIQLCHEPLESERLWLLDMDTGTLRLNIRHPLWVRCDETSDTVLMKFQEHLIIQALTVQAAPAEWQETVRLVVEEANPAVVFALTRGDALAGRGPGRPKAEKAKDKPKLGLVGAAK